MAASKDKALNWRLGMAGHLHTFRAHNKRIVAVAGLAFVVACAILAKELGTATKRENPPSASRQGNFHRLAPPPPIAVPELNTSGAPSWANRVERNQVAPGGGDDSSHHPRPLPPPRENDPTIQARKEREAWIDQLKDTGKTRAPWIHEAQKALDTVEREFASLGVRFSDGECWGGGCYVKATYGTLGDYWSSQENLIKALVQLWPQGNKTMTGPERQPNGEIVSYWIVRQPDSEH